MRVRYLMHVILLRVGLLGELAGRGRKKRGSDISV